jgi:hypothetical protein
MASFTGWFINEFVIPSFAIVGFSFTDEIMLVKEIARDSFHFIATVLVQHDDSLLMIYDSKKRIVSVIKRIIL